MKRVVAIAIVVSIAWSSCVITGFSSFSSPPRQKDLILLEYYGTRPRLDIQYFGEEFIHIRSAVLYAPSGAAMEFSDHLLNVTRGHYSTTEVWERASFHPTQETLDRIAAMLSEYGYATMVIQGADEELNYTISRALAQKLIDRMAAASEDRYATVSTPEATPPTEETPLSPLPPNSDAVYTVDPVDILIRKSNGTLRAVFQYNGATWIDMNHAIFSVGRQSIIVPFKSTDVTRKKLSEAEVQERINMELSDAQASELLELFARGDEVVFMLRGRLAQGYTLSSRSVDAFEAVIREYQGRTVAQPPQVVLPNSDAVYTVDPVDILIRKSNGTLRAVFQYNGATWIDMNHAIFSVGRQSIIVPFKSTDVTRKKLSEAEVQERINMELSDAQASELLDLFARGDEVVFMLRGRLAQGYTLSSRSVDAFEAVIREYQGRTVAQPPQVVPPNSDAVYTVDPVDILIRKSNGTLRAVFQYNGATWIDMNHAIFSVGRQSIIVPFKSTDVTRKKLSEAEVQERINMELSDAQASELLELFARGDEVVFTLKGRSAQYYTLSSRTIDAFRAVIKEYL